MGDKDQLTATVPANSEASVPIYINPTFQNRGKENDKYKLKKKHKASQVQFSYNVKSWEDICFSKNSFALFFNPCFGPKWPEAAIEAVPEKVIVKIYRMQKALRSFATGLQLTKVTSAVFFTDNCHCSLSIFKEDFRSLK